MLGWEEHAGLIDPGKWADLVAVAGNPLDDVTVLETVVAVMKGGTVYLEPAHN